MIRLLLPLLVQSATFQYYPASDACGFIDDARPHEVAYVEHKNETSNPFYVVRLSSNGHRISRDQIPAGHFALNIDPDGSVNCPQSELPSQIRLKEGKVQIEYRQAAFGDYVSKYPAKCFVSLGSILVQVASGKTFLIRESLGLGGLDVDVKERELYIYRPSDTGDSISLFSLTGCAKKKREIHLHWKSGARAERRIIYSDFHVSNGKAYAFLVMPERLREEKVPVIASFLVDGSGGYREYYGPCEIDLKTGICKPLAIIEGSVPPEAGVSDGGMCLDKDSRHIFVLLKDRLAVIDR